ncbi:uncharacterized protein LOC112528205 [Cynara cardunculus var. scolymus]|uniref:uncharacterized protein LOC112528205 n=1 Tax=Cynara cardunculus var. scolymus TaxID=59895 RepID=UPI000D62DB9F|nr:uncharacterized protein LOC112528205 [Cynara cardunculus var. scolymus]
MALIKDCTATKPPSTASRSSCFLGCFGCSGDRMQPTEEVNSAGSRRQSWVFKWKSSFKKSAAKTVPVDLATVPRKTKSFTLAPATSNTTWEIQVVEEDDATLTKKPVIMVEENHVPVRSDEQNSRRKKWIDIVKRQNRSYRSRRKEMKAAAVSPSHLDSPEKKSTTISHDPIVFSPNKPLTRSISPPPAKVKKPPHAPPADGGVDDKASNKTTPLGGGFDSIIGMSIILVTLVIMMLWGKVCAILCTSAWFFIAPRLGAAGEHSAVATAEKRLPEPHNNLDLDSVEYKKKVVLEGLLQRNHRNVVGRL